MSIYLLFPFEEGPPAPPVLYDFSPPIRSCNPPWRKETPLHERRFFAHYCSGAEAVNIHKLLTGEFTEAEGINPADIEITYRGAVVTPITSAEALDLIAAGYSVPSYEG